MLNLLTHRNKLYVSSFFFFFWKWRNQRTKVIRQRELRHHCQCPPGQEVQVPFSSRLVRSVFIFFSEPHERRTSLDCVQVLNAVYCLTLHVISLDVQFAKGHTFEHAPDYGVWWRVNLFPRWRRIPAGSREGQRGWGAGWGGGSTTGEGLFVVGFVAGALPVTIILPRSARPLKTCMTYAGS